MHSTWDPTRDLHIPPRIIYPNFKNIVLQFLFLQKIFLKVPILMDHPHTLQYLACRQDRGGHCSLQENRPFK